MKRRRVKITGIGPVTPAGIGREAFWKGILEPVSRVRRVSKFPDVHGTFIGAEVKDFRLKHFNPDQSFRRLPRHTEFAIAAAYLALADAGLTFDLIRDSSPLVAIGSCLMDFGTINKGLELVLNKGVAAGFPLSSVLTANTWSISGAIGELIGGIPRVLALQTACCAGLDAIGHAAALIAEGEAEIAICGGMEAPFFLHPMIELGLAGLSPGNPESPESQCRPFDLWRTTGVIGEGACMFVLEPHESLRAGYAYVEGYAYASDPVRGNGEGLERAIGLALANAQVRPAEIDSINAWGPGHRVIDAAEAKALTAIFGAGVSDIPAVSIKGAIGNPLGAAGAIQTACAALSLQSSSIPPTVNWRYPDPECALNLSGRVRHLRHSSTLVNTHGLSGTNSCLVLRQ